MRVAALRSPLSAALATLALMAVGTASCSRAQGEAGPEILVYKAPT